MTTAIDVARNAGIRDGELINGRTRGVSVDEMVKIVLLAKTEVLKYDENNNETTRSTTFEEMVWITTTSKTNK